MLGNQRLALVDLQCSATVMDARLHHAAVRCDAQHDHHADVSMRGESHQERVT